MYHEHWHRNSGADYLQVNCVCLYRVVDTLYSLTFNSVPLQFLVTIIVCVFIDYSSGS